MDNKRVDIHVLDASITRLLWLKQYEVTHLPLLKAYDIHIQTFEELESIVELTFKCYKEPFYFQYQDQRDLSKSAWLIYMLNVMNQQVTR